MRARMFLLLAALAGALLVASCGGGDSESAPPATTGGETQGETQGETETEAPPPDTGAATTEQEGGEIVKGGILRIGSADHIDSLNPFVAFNAQAYVAFVMTYPVLVQYGPGYVFEGDWAEDWTTSDDGLVWTFTVKPGSWSDGAPLTAEDGAWTCNTIVQYAKGPTAALAPFLSHVKECSAPDQQTLVITYDQPVGNVLPQLQQFFILPRHVWEQHLGNDGKDLKKVKPEDSLPLVAGGAFTITKYEKKGTTIYEKNPGFYGQEPYVDAVGLQVFTNEDAMIAAFQAGDLDAVDELPANAVVSIEADENLVVHRAPGFQVNNFIFNSNPDKERNRELLDPKVREAIAYAIDKQEIADTAYAGLAKPWGSIIAIPSGDFVNPNLQPEPFDIAYANQILDEAGYARGSDGIRVDPDGEKMEYEVITPTGVQGINREFEIVRAGLEQIGIAVTQKALDDTTAFEEIGAPDWQYLTFDMAMWDWVGYFDPDFVLSVLKCDQYGGWSDTAYCNPEYDALYEEQGVTVDQDARMEIIWRMQEILYNDRPYIQLVNLEANAAWSKKWDGLLMPELTGLSKRPWVEAHMVEG